MTIVAFATIVNPMTNENNKTTKNVNLQKLVRTLMFAYSYKKNGPQEYFTEQQTIETWILEYLANPNHRLAECVMPLLVEDFNLFLSNKGDRH